MIMNNITTDIDLTEIPLWKLESELKRRKELETDTTKIRTILKKLSKSEMEFLEQWLKEDPAWIKKEVTRMLASIYDP